MNHYIFFVESAGVCVYEAKKAGTRYTFSPLSYKGRRVYPLKEAAEAPAFWQWFDEYSGIYPKDEFRCCVLAEEATTELVKMLQQSVRQHEPAYQMMDGKDNAWEDACLRAFLQQELQETANGIQQDAVTTDTHTWQLAGLPEGLALKKVSPFDPKAHKLPASAAKKAEAPAQNVIPIPKVPVPPAAKEKPKATQPQPHVVPLPKETRSITKAAEKEANGVEKIIEEAFPAVEAEGADEPAAQLPKCTGEDLKEYFQEKTSGQCETIDLR